MIAKLVRAAPFLPFSNIEDVPLRDLSSHSIQNSSSKHIKQLESLTSHIQQAGLCASGNVFCELGCGTAKLSEQVCIKTKGDSSHFLIDRKKFSNTRVRDGSMKAMTKNSHQTVRLRLDIGSIQSLASTCGVDPERKSLVAISKHLCGSAADLSIQCCAPCNTPMAIATCCHYICDWDSFMGKTFVTSLGFTKRDFQVLTIVSQWASLDKASKAVTTPSEDKGWMEFSDLPQLSTLFNHDCVVESSEFERTFSRKAKTDLGKRCKLFLDTARAYSLKEMGYRVKLVRYTTMSIEDRLLIAMK